MKNKCLLAIIAIAFTQFSYAQETKEVRYINTTFGFKGGFNQSYVSTEFNNGYEGLEAYGGLFLDNQLSKNWSVQNELLVSFTDSYIFIEVPILAKYNLNSRWSFFAGPKLDFLVNEPLAGENLNPLGLSAAIGTQYNIGKRFFLEARYSYGLTRQIDVDDFIKGDRRTLRLGAGIKF